MQRLTWKTRLVNPTPVSEAVQNVMRANRASNTAPERILRSALRKAGLLGYRLHWKKAPAGRPDICFPAAKIAIFVHGCFWHNCPHCKRSLPKSNTEFWKEKFRRNEERDRKNRIELEEHGWRVFTFWECRIRKNTDHYVKQVVRVISRRQS